MATPKTQPEAKEFEEQTGTLKYKTWVFKVSLHCEGCKKKVKKILHRIEGVYETDIDLRQQKVTVKGNIDAEILIKKLAKSGKYTEPWPEKSVSIEKKKEKGKKKVKQSNPTESSEETNHGDDKEKQSNPAESSEETNHGVDKKKQTVKGEVQIKEPAKNTVCEDGSTSKSNGNVNKTSTSEAGKSSPVKEAAGGQVKEPKPEADQTVTASAGSQSPPEEKNEAEKIVGGGPVGNSSGSGSGGKKKKKKGQIGNTDKNDYSNANEGNEREVPEHNEVFESPSPNQGQDYSVQNPGPGPSNHMRPHHPPFLPHHPPFLPHHPGFQYSPYYRPPPSLAYGMSYNTAYPTNNYAASYYSVPPPSTQSHIYPDNYMHQGAEMEVEPSPYYAQSQSRPLDSFELFNEENPNACSIM